MFFRTSFRIPGSGTKRAICTAPNIAGMMMENAFSRSAGRSPGSKRRKPARWARRPSATLFLSSSPCAKAPAPARLWDSRFQDERNAPRSSTN